MEIKRNDYQHFQLWETNIDKADPLSLQDIEEYFSVSEKVHFASLSNKNKKLEFLASRALVRHALSELFKKPFRCWNIDYVKNSRPIVNNLPLPIRYSLSHSKGYINFATSYKPIGIDIEKRKLKKNLLELSTIFMSASEFKHIKLLDDNSKETFFYKIWCLKEAYFKVLPKKLQLEFSPCTLSILEHIDESLEFSYFDLTDNVITRAVVIHHF